MTWRTPSSLKWLIVRHSRQQGVLHLQERQAGKLQEQLDAALQSIAETKANLEAIERTLTLHEIPVNVAEIEAIVPQLNPRLFTFGELTRRIYKALRESGGWVTTEEVIRHVTGLDKGSADPAEYRHARSVLRDRLKKLAWSGKLERAPCQVQPRPKPSLRQTKWRLPQDTL